MQLWFAFDALRLVSGLKPGRCFGIEARATRDWGIEIKIGGSVDLILAPKSIASGKRAQRIRTKLSSSVPKLWQVLIKSSSRVNMINKAGY